jgi:hypothetical protein
MVSDRSNGIYRRVVALIGLAIVAAALFFLIRDLSTVDAAYRNSAANASIKYHRDAEAYVKESCITSTGLREVDCATKADEAAREGQRKEQDLAAQNITAWWTKVMGIAALIGMALSAVGVWLVKTTFDETRKANQIARETMRRQLRAYIGIHKFIWRGELGDFRLKIQWKNTGQTPAHGVHTWADCMVTDSPLPESHIFQIPPKREDDWPSSVGLNSPIAAKTLTSLTPDIVMNSTKGMCYIYAWGRVDYTDVFGDARYCEVAVRMANSLLPEGSLATDWVALHSHNVST